MPKPKLTALEEQKRIKILEHVANGMSRMEAAELYGFTSDRDRFRVHNWVTTAGGARHLRNKAQCAKLRKDPAS